MFIPPGCVLLTAAVARLAEAWRTAGQANDDGKNAAQVELRAELYSGSMLAMVVSPSSGDSFAIRPQYWAREIALTWLEQGECLLNEDFVYPWPLFLAPSAQSVGCPESIPPEPPSLLRGERATILVSEHDCQRLMAQRTAKQEYSDHGPPVRLAEAKIEPEFRRWREQHPSGYIPTESEDAAHMKQFGVSRDTVRELRKGYPRRPRGQKKSDKAPNIRG